jgi:hypothetical protein
MKSAYKLMTEKSNGGIEEQAAPEVLELEEIALQTWEDEGGSVKLDGYVDDRAEPSC